MEILRLIAALFIFRQYNDRSQHRNREACTEITKKCVQAAASEDDRSCSSLSPSPRSSSPVQVFARFSPLIGGPALLPIHAEIMILDRDNSSEIPGIANNGDGGCSVVHRIDFVPKDPKDLDTILKLITMQNVPGTVRHRKFASGSSFRNRDFLSSDEINVVPQKRIQRLLTTTSSVEKVSIVFPLGEIILNEDERFVDSVRSPRSIVELVDKKHGMELNLLRNNCYSFAFEILSCLKL